MFLKDKVNRVKSKIKKEIRDCLLYFLGAYGSLGLTQEFLETNADIMDWKFASLNAPIESFPEEFILKYESFWDWKEITRRRDLSDIFLINYIPQIIKNTDSVFITKEYSAGFMKKIFIECHKQRKTFNYIMAIQNQNIFSRHAYKELINTWYWQTVNQDNS